MIGTKKGGRSTDTRDRAGRNVYFDISMVEGVRGVPPLITETSPSRVVFGSHYPLFYFESALLKVREAGLPEAQPHAVLEGNARTLLGR